MKTQTSTEEITYSSLVSINCVTDGSMHLIRWRRNPVYQYLPNVLFAVFHFTRILISSLGLIAHTAFKTCE